jgi:hypothetical protein
LQVCLNPLTLCSAARIVHGRQGIGWYLLKNLSAQALLQHEGTEDRDAEFRTGHHPKVGVSGSRRRRCGEAAGQPSERCASRRGSNAEKKAEFLDGKSFDLARLERQVNLDEETSVSYVRSAEESHLSNAVEGSKLLCLRIIEEASLPLEAVAPKKGRSLVFAPFGGLLLSVGLGLARDHLDRTVKSSVDVRRSANLVTLVALPDRS